MNLSLFSNQRTGPEAESPVEKDGFTTLELLRGIKYP
jgi:hypothetical protein